LNKHYALRRTSPYCDRTLWGVTDRRFQIAARGGLPAPHKAAASSAVKPGLSPQDQKELDDKEGANEIVD
jgi:hypothetical protein